jgi:hypothetical protein
MEHRPRIYYTDAQKALNGIAGRKANLSMPLHGCFVDTTRRYEGSWRRVASYGKQTFADAAP